MIAIFGRGEERSCSARDSRGMGVRDMVVMLEDGSLSVVYNILQFVRQVGDFNIGERASG